MAWLFHLDKVQNWAYMNDVFSEEECAKIKKLALEKEMQPAVVCDEYDANKNKLEPQFRKNGVIWLNTEDEKLHWIYDKLSHTAISLNKQFFNFDLYGFTESLQFTEYNAPDNFYIEHMDKLLYGVSRKLSIVLQLTDPNEYEGGELLFNVGGNKYEVAPKAQGTVLAFPSYMLHQVKPITKGTRHSIVTWISGPDFK